MTDINPNVNLDPIEDSLSSVRRWIHEEYPSKTILIEREISDFTRPIFKIDPVIVPSTFNDLTPMIWQSIKHFRIRYHGVSRKDCDEVLSHLDWRIKTGRRVIPHIITDLKYVQPSLREDNTATMLGAGDYNVQVAAETIHDEYTLASDIAQVTIGVNKAIKVFIPQAAGGVRYFKNFKIYASLSGVTKLVATIPCNPIGEITSYVITSLIDGEVIPTSSEIHFKYLTAQVEDLVYLEDPTANGIWDGIITLRTEMKNSRQEILKELMGGVFSSI